MTDCMGKGNRVRDRMTFKILLGFARPVLGPGRLLKPNPQCDSIWRWGLWKVAQS